MTNDFNKYNLHKWLYYQDDKTGLSLPLPLEELNDMPESQYNLWVAFAPRLEKFKEMLKEYLNIDLDTNLITSSFRNEARTLRAGSSLKSQHFQGCAIDIKDHDLKIKNWLLTLNTKNPIRAEIENLQLYFIVDYSRFNIVHIQGKSFSDNSKIVYSLKQKTFLL